MPLLPIFCSLRPFLCVFLSVSIAVAPRSVYAQQAPSKARQIQYRYFLGATYDGDGRISEIIQGAEARRAGLRVGDIIKSINGIGGFRNTEQLSHLIVSEAEENSGTLLILFQRGANQHFLFAELGRINDAGGNFTFSSHQPQSLKPVERLYNQLTVSAKTSSLILNRARSIKDHQTRFATISRNMRFFQTTVSAIDVLQFPSEVQRRHRALVNIMGKMAEVTELGPSTRTEKFLRPWGEELKRRVDDLQRLIDYMRQSGINADLALGPKLTANLDMELRVPERAGWQDTSAGFSNEALIGAGLLLVGGLIVASMVNSGDAAAAPDRGTVNQQGQSGTGSSIKTVFNCSRCGWSGDYRPPRCPSCKEGTFFWMSQK